MSMQKRKRDDRFVDIVVQLPGGFVGIECHGAKEHDIHSKTMEADEAKQVLWRRRMPGNPELVSVYRPAAMDKSTEDGTWQQYVYDKVLPALQQVL